MNRRKTHDRRIPTTLYLAFFSIGASLFALATMQVSIVQAMAHISTQSCSTIMGQLLQPSETVALGAAIASVLGAVGTMFSVLMRALQSPPKTQTQLTSDTQPSIPPQIK